MARVELAFIGDVMLGRGVNEEIGHRPPEYFWGTTLPVLRSADAVVANLECAITKYLTPWQKSPKVFHFRADLPAVDVLRAANVRCVSLANNHILDFQEQGLLDTMKHLNAARIHHAGAGQDMEEAEAPAVFDAGGIKVGFIAFTDNEPLFATGINRPGTNYMPIMIDETTLARVGTVVSGARSAGADIVVLSLHWGPNMVPRPPVNFRSFAAAAIDLGVDLIHGHSAHIFQGVQLCGQRIVMYDTGDFIDDYAVDSDLRNDWSFIFMVSMESEGPCRLRMIPVRLSYAQVNLAKGREFEAIRERMRILCTEFDTRVIDISEGLEVVIKSSL